MKMREISVHSYVIGLGLVSAMLITLYSCSSGGGDSASSAPGTGPASNPAAARAIAQENQNPGTTSWGLASSNSPALNHEIEAYADRESYPAGADVRIAVSANPAGQFTYQVFRLGGYGGTGARQYAQGGPLFASTQSSGTFDPITGLVRAGWSPTFTITTRDSSGNPWLRGVYLVLFTKENGLQSYTYFVLRDDSRDAEVGVLIPTATHQAYNDWGGESLYVSQHGLSGGKARKVSYDRPFNGTWGFGVATLLSQEHQFIIWLEDHGYDVEYFTSVDVAASNGRVGGHRIFIALGHDEYTTLAALDRYTAARDAGTSLAFFTANTYYWQIRYEDGDKTIVCYKDQTTEDPALTTDPQHLSTRFRDPPVNRPENALLGVMSDGDFITGATDWVVTSSSHWVYAGTGVTDGTRLPQVVGNEWDGLVNNGQTPSGVTVLASSEIQPGSRHESTIYERGNAFVFAAGSLFFPNSVPAQPVIAQMVTNMLARAGATAYQP